MHQSTITLPSMSDSPKEGISPPAVASVEGRGHPRLLLVFRTGDDGASAILRGIAHYQQTYGGWSALAENCEGSADDWNERLAQGWDGVISQYPAAALVAACAARALPLVALDDGAPDVAVSRIRPDHGALGAMGAEHLLELGLRSFAFVGQESPGWARQRQNGFVEALRLGGHGAATFVFPSVGAGATDGRAGDGLALGHWLRGLPKPVGVMACDDRRATQVLEAAREIGCLVPEDVAVLGADNAVVRCELATPTLSSVDPGLFQLGYGAAEHLGRRGDGRAAGRCDLRLDPAGVVTRRSTAVLAIPDRAVAAAAQYIAAHACEGLTVAEVVPHAAVSRSQLEKKFRQYLGRSPQAEIRRVQVARIRQLLVETDLPLKGIAGQTGFAYLEYMCVVFRRLTGETPGAYRRRFAGGGVAAPNARPGFGE